MTVNLTVNHPLSILAIQEKEMNGVRYYQLSFCLRNTMGPRLQCGKPCSIEQYQRVAFILLIYHVGNLKLQEVKLPSSDLGVVEVEMDLKVSPLWDQQGKLDKQVSTSPQIVQDTRCMLYFPLLSSGNTEISYASRHIKGGIPFDSLRNFFC